MKNLDLNSYGVQEMNTTEVKNIDGGFFAILAAVLAYELVTEGPVKCYNDMRRGMEKSLNAGGYTSY